MLAFDVKRTMNQHDIDEVTALLKVIEQAEGRKPLNDHLWIDLRQGGRPGFAGLTARDSNTNLPIAYCQISRSNDSWALDFVISPQFRAQTLEVGSSLLGQAAQLISAEGGGHIHWWVSEPHTEHKVLAEKLGLNNGRRLLQMKVQLPLADSVIAKTKTVATRGFIIGKDEDQWVNVNNRAFGNHPDQGGWTREILTSRQTEKWFNPNDLLLHFTDGTENLSAFCWTKIDRETNQQVGEIYVIAVDPQHHGKGLGRALSVAGLQHMTSQGATTGVLFVDQDNQPAVATYQKLGFVTDHIEQAFVGDIN